MRNVEAEEVAGLLTQLFSATGGQDATTRPGAEVAPGLTPAQVETPSGGEGAAPPSPSARGPVGTTLDGESASLGDSISVVADATNNSLLILATPRDYAVLLDALEKLDIVPLQVLVEATIVEVRLEGDFEFGVQWTFDQGSRSDTSLIGASELSPVVPGFNWTLLSSAGQVKAVLNTLASDSLVNVLSSPSVMVLDNQTARIQVGDQVPIATTQQSGTDTTSNLVNSIEYRDTGVLLTVTPRVNPGGLVIMDVEQEVSDVTETETSGLDSPTIQTRNVTSSVAVQSGQVVVLGGLIRDRSDESDSGIPGLYKLPVIGWLFGETSESTSRTELVVVIQPRVVANQQDADGVVDAFRSRLKGRGAASHLVPEVAPQPLQARTEGVDDAVRILLGRGEKPLRAPVTGATNERRACDWRENCLICAGPRATGTHISRFETVCWD